jgi:glutamine amidotransferase-like uncharacterized protein
VQSEIDNPKSPVQNDEDTVIQVDWNFRNGSTKNNRWLYFQEGAYITEFNASEGQILARYSKSRDIAASVTKYGQGWVGLTGPHPEADQTWCKCCLSFDIDCTTMANVLILDDAAEIKNPDGISRDFVLDFLAATLAGEKTVTVSSGIPADC